MYSQNDNNWFESQEDYWRLPNRPVLGQIFEEKGKDWKPRTRAALPRWFSHLLPEGRLRSEAAAAARINPVREFQLLERLGADDLPGALRATPVASDGSPTPPSTPVSHEDEELTPILKFSLAGIQLKFSISTDDRGPTVPVSGKSGDSILKLPDGRPGYAGVPEAEYAAMKLARGAGIDVAPVSLIDATAVPGLERWSTKLPGNSLLVQRFDRLKGGKRVHVEELAQVLDIPTAQTGSKYLKANFETIANVVSKIVGVSAVGEVIDRIVLNVLVGNGDAHLKNWAITYPNSRVPSLSPAYDIVPTVLYLNQDDLGLNLNGTKEFSALTPASFERLGAVSGFGHDAARERATAAVGRILDQWSILRDLLPREQFIYLDSRLAALKLVSQSPNS